MDSPIVQGNDLFLPISKGELCLSDTLECGQCFRFGREADGSFAGVARGRLLRLSQTGEGIRFYDTALSDYEALWKGYFDLDTDYAPWKARFSEDPVLAKAEYGIRILRQEPFEALITFILSQNSNIPRIRASVERLCARYGEPLGEGRFAFPTAKRLAAVSDFSGLRFGYREAYVYDCAQRIGDGRLDLSAVEKMPLCEARQALRQIRGVGPKVAECALLFGFHRLEAFPVDTWIKKALARYYPGGFPQALQPAGVAQQYLFHYIRTLGNE